MQVNYDSSQTEAEHNATIALPAQIDICDSANSNLVHLETVDTHEQIATVNKGRRPYRLAMALELMQRYNAHQELVSALREVSVFLGDLIVSGRATEQTIELSKTVVKALERARVN